MKTTVRVSIKGMTCQSCVKTVMRALEAIPGLDPSSIDVRLDTSEATMTVLTDVDQRMIALISSTIEDLGYDAGTPVVDNHPDNNTQTDSLRSASTNSDNTSTLLHGTIQIEGMTCSHCTNAVHGALAQLPHAIPDSIHVSLNDATATLLFTGPIDERQLADAIESLGYDVVSVHLRPADRSGSQSDQESTGNTNVKTATIQIMGMTCSHCTRTITEALQSIPGIISESVQVDLNTHSAQFNFENDSLDTDMVINAIEDLGYVATGTHISTPTGALSYSRSPEEMPDPGLRKVVMRVIGMTCASCVTAVTDALETQVTGVQPGSVHVDLETEMAMFLCRNPKSEEVRKAVEQRGFVPENIQIIHNLVQPAVLTSSTTPLQRQRSRTAESVVSLGAITIDSTTVAVPKKVTLQVTGMTCASCVRTLEQGLSVLPSVEQDSVKVNLLTGVASFSVSGDVLDEATIIEAVERIGYGATNVAIIAEQQVLGPSTATHQVDMIVTGMYCGNCVEKVRSALIQLPGTQPNTIIVGEETGRTTFQYTGDAITRQRIQNAILQVGLMADSINITKISDSQPSADRSNPNHSITRLTVTGMTCSSCVANIERAIMRQAGVASCQVNLLAKSAVVVHDPSVIGARTLANMIEQLGYKAELATYQSDALADQRASMRATLNKEISELRRRFLWSLLFAIPIAIFDMIFMMALPEHNRVRMAFMKEITAGLTISDLVSFCLATPVQFWLGLPFYVKAYRSLRYARTANMETLVAMGTTVAYATSVGTIIADMVKKHHGESMNYFETSVLLITFIHFGKWLEALAKGKTAETITKLMDLQPDRAILVEVSTRPKETSLTPINTTTSDTTSSDKSKTQTLTAVQDEILVEREIDVKDIQVGDILKVNAGGRIPCDGKIWRGTTSTDESMITGESVPVVKKESDDVITATINLSSPIYIRAIRVGSDTTLSRIIQLVQDAQASPKAPIEQVADKISSVFVPIVIFLAIATFIIWQVASAYNIYPESWVPMGESKTTFSVMLAVSVLVIACPCGLGLASPTAVMVGTGIAAKHGVLVKGGGYALEMANRITTIAFDKTGTLTMGKPVTTDSWLSSTNEEQTATTWKILGRVASTSNHPLSKAIETRARLELGYSEPSETTAAKDEKQETTKDAFDGIVLANAKEIPGRGILATITLSEDEAKAYWQNGQQHRAINVFMGNQAWMDENRGRYANRKQATACHAQLNAWQDKGQSIVMMAVSPVVQLGTQGEEAAHTEGCNNACGCAVCNCSSGSSCCSTSRTMIVAQLAVADVPRPEAKGVIAELRRQDIEVWMITGDNIRTGQVIAEQLGIDRDCVLAGVKPEQKADKIRNLQRRVAHPKSNTFWNTKRFKSNKSLRTVVAMVGDGINDSPSLAQADVGISVGSATDVAIEAASIVLIRNNLWDLLTMYDVSGAVVRRIRINFLWAFIYNVVAIPIAAGILYPGTGHGLPPYIAGIAMVASSVSVVCSSLLLRLYQAPRYAESQ